MFFQEQLQVGAIIYIFDAETLTPRTVYKDGLATIPWLQASPGNTPPPGCLKTDSSGCIPVIFIVGNPFKIRIVSAGGVQIREIDDIPGDTAAGGGGGGGGGTATLNTGDYVWAHTTAIITGRVRANGKTLGNAISGATERANADTVNLFTFLYNADANLAVSGGRGASAAADYAANKTIALPDLNCRGLRGIDGMGSSATGRLAGGLFASGNATTLGSTGGEATHTLTTAEIAAHQHTGTTVANAAFQMTGTTASGGSHVHTGTTATAGSHNHGGLTGSENANHTHTLTTSNDGSHDHGGSTGGASAFFQMLSVGTSINPTVISVPTTATGAGNFQNVLGTTSTLNLGLSGTWFQDHHHSITNDGTHFHTGSTSTQSTNHQHAISTDPGHVHTFTTDAGGTHAHTFTTDLGGAHVHTFTSNITGGGGAHNNLDPFILATAYIVL